MPTPSEILASQLADRGVKHAFGMPGGVVLPLVEAFERHGIEFVLVRHEGSAGFMADACAQLTGAPGVCVATLGPGATNLVSGLAGALLDRAPVVAVTGQVSPGLANVYTHQTLDQAALFRPVCKHSVTLSAEQAWREIPLALRHLELGRRGPIHLNIPAEVFTAPQPEALPDRFEPVPAEHRLALIDEALPCLAQARRPVMLVGLGQLDGAVASAVGQLAERYRMPVISTYKAKGVPDEDHPWYAGSFGLSTTVDLLQQQLLASADLLLMVGLDPVELRPQWLPGWPSELPVIALDRAAPHDLVHPIEQLYVGDIARNLSWLLQDEGGRSAWTLDELGRHWDRMAALFTEDTSEMGPAAAIGAVQAGFPDDGICALDVGAHRITASHVWTCRKPNTLLQSNGLSSMGYGLPAAIAAKLARPDLPALALTGDMGLWMTLGELGLAAERGLDLTVVYLADRSLSLIELKQQRMGLPQAGVRFDNPDVVALASAFGGLGVTVDNPDDLEQAVARASAQGGLQLIEARIDPSPYATQV